MTPRSSTMIIALLAAWSSSCTKDTAQPAATAEAKVPIVVYYSLPG